MANKKYNQFAAGTPDAADITLFADPATGALNKCTVPVLLAVANPTILAVRSDDVTNTGAGDVDYLSYTIPANTWTTNAKGFELLWYGRGLNYTGGPLWYLKKNGVDFRTYAPGSGTSISCRVALFRITAGNVAIDEFGYRDTAFFIHQVNFVSGMDWTIDNTFTLGTRTTGAGSLRTASAFFRAIYQ